MQHFLACRLIWVWAKNPWEYFWTFSPPKIQFLTGFDPLWNKNSIILLMFLQFDLQNTTFFGLPPHTSMGRKSLGIFLDIFFENCPWTPPKIQFLTGFDPLWNKNSIILLIFLQFYLQNATFFGLLPHMSMGRKSLGIFLDIFFENCPWTPPKIQFLTGFDPLWNKNSIILLIVLQFYIQNSTYFGLLPHMSMGRESLGIFLDIFFKNCPWTPSTILLIFL